MNTARATSHACSFSVHASIRYSRAFTFSYKGTEFRYVPAKIASDSDNLMCRQEGLSYADAYHKAYEFWSAVCLTEKVRLLLGSGISDVFMGKLFLHQVSYSEIERRKIAIMEDRLKISKIAKIENQQQAYVLRLFRHAFTQNDAFTKALFYFHTLTYPDKCEKKAVDYISANFDRIDSQLENYRPQAKERQFRGTAKDKDWGTYIKLGIRHSIAHIVRNNDDYKPIDLDNLHQQWHLQYICDVLELMCGEYIRDFFKVSTTDVEFLDQE